VRSNKLATKRITKYKDYMRVLSTSMMLLGSVTHCLAQNCVISGGENFGTITQNCTINPQPAPLSIISKDFDNVAGPNGSFRRQIFVKIGQPSTLLLIACGDGVVDLGASPWPAGMVSVSNKMTKDNCLAYRFFNTSPGQWAFWVDTSAADTKFKLEPSIEQ
jgi:hypothetical protein